MTEYRPEPEHDVVVRFKRVVRRLDSVLLEAIRTEVVVVSAPAGRSFA